MNTASFPFCHSDFTLKWVTSNWERRQAMALRRRVFCREQGLFERDDRDDIDRYAQCLVAVANCGGWPDRVVGTVRIHRDREGVWWGSRLAVDVAYRRGTGIGAALIRLAVGSARALGCTTFMAQVQQANEGLFQRLHWRSCRPLRVRDRSHVLMEADLSQYPPCHSPRGGFSLRGAAAAMPAEMAPFLLGASAMSRMEAAAYVAH